MRCGACYGCEGNRTPWSQCLRCWPSRLAVVMFDAGDPTVLATTDITAAGGSFRRLVLVALGYPAKRAYRPHFGAPGAAKTAGSSRRALVFWPSARFARLAGIRRPAGVNPPCRHVEHSKISCASALRCERLSTLMVTLAPGGVIGAVRHLAHSWPIAAAHQDSDRRPMASALYQWFVRLVVLLFVAIFCSQYWDHVAPLGFKFTTRISDRRKMFLTEVPTPAGAVLVLAPFLLRRHQKDLAELMLLLRKLSLERSYNEWLARRARRDVAVFSFIWVAIMAAAGFQTVFAERDRSSSLAWDALRLSMAAIFSGAILCLAHTMVYICRALHVMIDAFCCDIVGNMELQQAPSVRACVDQSQRLPTSLQRIASHIAPAR